MANQPENLVFEYLRRLDLVECRTEGIDLQTVAGTAGVMG